MDQFIAGYGPLPADLAASEDMDADRLARLLDRTGPVILLTHSASGPSRWLAADRRSTVLRPAASDAQGSARRAARLPAPAEPARFADCVVTGDTSAFAAASPAIVAALKAGGVCAEQLHLPDHGVTGNARLDLREKLRPSAG